MRYLLVVLVLLAGCAHTPDPRIERIDVFFEKPARPHKVIGMAHASDGRRTKSKDILRKYAVDMGGDAILFIGQESLATRVNNYGRINYTTIYKVQILKYQ